MQLSIAALATLLCLAFAPDRSLAQIVVENDGRYVSADGGPPVPPPGGSLSWSAVGTGGTATQDSWIGGNFMSGSGTIVTDVETGLAESVFDLQFTVYFPTAGWLYGEITSDAGAVRTGSLSDSLGNVLALDGSFGGGPLDELVFTPGVDYRLTLSVANAPGGGGAGSWSLTLVVPEPELLWIASLMALAALALLRARRASAPAQR